jgi:hypothetical protein
MSRVSSIEALAAEARALEREGLKHMTVWTPQGWKPPAGFPRRYFLSAPTSGGRNYHVRVDKLLAWCAANASK